MLNLCENFRIWHDGRPVEDALYCYARIDEEKQTYFEVGVLDEDGGFRILLLYDIKLERYLI